MSEHYEETTPSDDGRWAMRPPTAEELFQPAEHYGYQAHHNREPDVAAASIARPDLVDEISFFNLGDLRGDQMKPELIAAMENFRDSFEQYGATPTPEHEAQYDHAENTAANLAIEAINGSDPKQNQLNREGDNAVAVEAALVSEVQGPFRDGDDDFDYEAHHNSQQIEAVPETLIPLGASRHVDEGRRIVPATPVFDSALKARQQQSSAATDKDAPGRIRAFLQKIRTTEKKNDLGPDVSDSARGLEQARSRGLSRGR